jgi:hypothetical protein
MSYTFKKSVKTEEGKVERSRRDYRRRKREIDEELEKQNERDRLRRGDYDVPERESILNPE